MNPTSPQTIRDLFAAPGSSREVKWDALAAWLVLALRSERDGPLVIAQEMCRRMVRDGNRLVRDAAALAAAKDMTNVAVDSQSVARYSSKFRRVFVPQPDTILSGIENEGVLLATQILESGSRIENVKAMVDAGTDFLAAWGDVGEVVAGAIDWFATLESLPPVDLAYLVPRVTSAMSAAAWSTTSQDLRQATSDAVLSSVVLTRLARRSPVPPLVHGSYPFTPTGKCDPAQKAGANSGPYRVVKSTCDTIQATTGPNQSESIGIPNALGELVFRLGTTLVDGKYHSDLPAGQYTVEMDAAILTGALLNLTLSTQQWPLETVITPAAVAAAINNAGVPGVTAAPVAVGTNGMMTVEVTCAAPVSGPSGWVRFWNPSNAALMTLIGFPDLVLTQQSMSAAELAQRITALGLHVDAVVESRTRGKGNTATMWSAPNEIVISRLCCGAAFSKTTVTPNPQMVVLGSIREVQVGDECWVGDANPVWEKHYVTAVGDDSFEIDSDVQLSLPVMVTVNPTLADPITGVGSCINLGSRSYRISTIGYVVNPVDLRMRAAYTGTRSHYEIISAAPWTVFQETTVIRSTDTTTSSSLSLAQTNLRTEVGWPPGVAVPTAYEIEGDYTANETMRCRIRPGDTIQTNMNTGSAVAAVDDGKITVSPGIAVATAMTTITITNDNRSAWEQIVAQLRLLNFSVFDADRFSDLLKQLRASGNQAVADELVSMVSFTQNMNQGLSQIAAFTTRKMYSASVGPMLTALKGIKAWEFYDRLTKGDLTVLLSQPREMTREGVTTSQSGEIGKALRTGLTALERLVVGSRNV